MQELEREIEALRKDRARLEANLHDAASDAQNLRELRVELASLKVSLKQVGPSPESYFPLVKRIFYHHFLRFSDSQILGEVARTTD